MDKKTQVVSVCFKITLLLSVIFLSISRLDIPTSSSYNSITCGVEASSSNNLSLLFSTFLGGDEGGEHGFGIAVTDDGCYFIMGSTSSSDFPTKNAYDDTFNGNSDTFVTKFSPDNALLWSTFFGGSDIDVGHDISVASDGSCYIIGTTWSIDFPTKNGYQSTYGGGKGDVFITKFSSSGSLLWSTYLGGSFGFENGFSITISKDDRSCYVTGEIQSSDFPTKKAYDSTYNGGNFDTFVAKFSSYGRLLWSSYLGGNENEAGNAIATAYDGSCYVTGRTVSSNFPTLNAYDMTQNGGWDIFVSKFSSKGKLLWSTYLGGGGWDEALGITVARDGNYYLAGYTGSNDFPTLNAYDNTYEILGDAFVSKFAANDSLIWSTYLGGNGTDRAYDIVAAVDCSCYVIGETFSSNFPTPNAYDATYNNGYDIFTSRFAANGSLLWGTYFGGSEGGDKGYSIAPSKDGKCYITGTTYSDDFPTQNASDTTLGYGRDAFVTVFIDPFPLIPCPEIFPSLFYFHPFYVIMVFFGSSLIIVVILYSKRE